MLWTCVVELIVLTIQIHSHKLSSCRSSDSFLISIDLRSRKSHEAEELAKLEYEICKDLSELLKMNSSTKKWC